MRGIILDLLLSVLMVCGLASTVYGSDLVPLAPNQVGLTTQKSPSLCWVQRQPIVGSDIMFTLKDSLDVKATLEVQLPASILADSDSCHCVHLKDYDIELEPNSQYHWFISFTQISEVHTQNVVAGGMIERCDDECMFLEGQSQCDLEASLRSAHAGAWYDSISCLCKLIAADPHNQELRRLLDRLLKDAGIILVGP